MSNVTGSTECSMEFHGTQPSPNTMSPSSMEFHGTRRTPFQMIAGFRGISWNIPWNSMELCRRQIKCNKVQWNSVELGEHHFKWHQGSVKSHGIFNGRSWNLPPPNQINRSSMEFNINYEKSFMEFYGIRVAPFQMSQVQWNIPLIFVELSLRQIRGQQVLWNSMELGGRHFKWHQSSLEFHGILEL